MTEQQIATVVQLRLEGNSSSAIAEATGISINTIKSYCSRHGIPASRRVRTCLLCHAEVTSAQRFCSDACRLEWYKSHQNEKPELLRICKACGALFELRQKNQEYCSKQCFYTDRYHQKSKADEVTANQRLLAFVAREAALAIVCLWTILKKADGYTLIMAVCLTLTMLSMHSFWNVERSNPHEPNSGSITLSKRYKNKPKTAGINGFPAGLGLPMSTVFTFSETITHSQMKQKQYLIPNSSKCFQKALAVNWQPLSV